MNENTPLTSVVITDIRMPFWSMVVLMVKWAIAAIPAIIILAGIGLLCTIAVTITAASFNGFISNRASHAISRPEVPAEPQRYDTNGPTDSEKRCASSEDPKLCMAAEQRCAGNPEKEKCMALTLGVLKANSK